ncbi:MAG TPA: PilT/PilU family type 4a pilus ATPase [Motilibacterales bacterium]|nr:PilT/PilU family type 4a pilus ATPase [Motilibacterales bacterium]
MTQAPVSVESLMAALWEAGGTDLHLSAGACPMLRVNGVLQAVAGTAPLTPADMEGLVGSLLSDQQLAGCRVGIDTDFSFGWRGLARIRGNAFRQRNTLALALRIMPHAIPSFDDLGVPPVVRDIATLTQGLVLVTGPTGSGKSTTLASIVDWIAANRAAHVITIEDPIEYVHTHQMSSVNQRAVGEDTPSFGAALRSALREDPDVLLVGELRDLESIRFALTLAETGHLVLATAHTNDASQTIDRIVEVFPGSEQGQIRTQLALALTAIVHQRLLPRLDGGQVAVFEVLLANSPVRSLVKDGRSNQLRNQIVVGHREGMVTLEESFNALIRDGVISRDQAAARSAFPHELIAG